MRAARYDLVVIGGGAAGLVASIAAAGLGARVLLAERERTGGDCLWTGCVPSKALIDVARRVHQQRTAAGFGLDPVDVAPVDLGRVMGHVRAVQAAIEPQDAPDTLRADGVEVVHGHATLARPGRVDVDGQAVRTRAVLLATGSRPAIPPVPGLAAAAPLTSETVWDLDTLPARLVVIGGGAIGCELGQAFGRLGSEVTIVEREDRLLPAEEADVGALIAGALAGEGVTVRTDTKVLEVADGVVTIDGPAGREDVAADRVLVAAGRVPVTDGLGLERAGVAVDERGAVVVDDRLRTTARNVYAAGDVTGGETFTHVAALHGGLAAADALFRARQRGVSRRIPRVVFTDPEVAAVGLGVDAARRRHGDRVVVTTVDHRTLDRAVTSGAPAGFTRLVADPRGRVVGATIVGPAAGEAVAAATAWVAEGRTLTAAARTVHAYPTMTEGLQRAAIVHVRERWFQPRVQRLVRPLLALLRVIDRPR